MKLRNPYYIFYFYELIEEQIGLDKAVSIRLNIVHTMQLLYKTEQDR